MTMEAMSSKATDEVTLYTKMHKDTQNHQRGVELKRTNK